MGRRQFNCKGKDMSLWRVPKQYFCIFAFVFSSLFCITTCTTYNVAPDDTTCHHCHSLQYYLLNTTKYFTSNTQLLFLPGLHHLFTNLVVQNAHNISLIGSATNGTPDTVIQCDSSVGIVLTNITTLIIHNMVIQNCATAYNLLQTAILVNECNFIDLFSVHIYHPHNGTSLLGVNVLGTSNIKHLIFVAAKLLYEEKNVITRQHAITVENCTIIENSAHLYGIIINMNQVSYKLTFVLSRTTGELQKSKLLRVVSRSINNSEVIITDCYFMEKLNNTIVTTIFSFSNVTVHLIKSVFKNFCRVSLITIMHRNVTISHCEFMLNNMLNRTKSMIAAVDVPQMDINHSKFHNNNGSVLYCYSCRVTVKNTTFSVITSLIMLQIVNTELVLIGPVIFHKISSPTVVSLVYSTVTVSHYIQFSYNNVYCLIFYDCKKDECFFISIGDNTIINVTNNLLGAFFRGRWQKHPTPISTVYPPCFFQYFGSNSHKTSIMFNNNTVNLRRAFDNLSYKAVSILGFRGYSQSKVYITHCYWMAKSRLNNTFPPDVNREYLHLNDSNLILQETWNTKSLCVCYHDKKQDCYKDELGPLYPGQTLSVFFRFALFALNTEVIVETDTNQTYFTPCIVKPEENVQLIGTGCNNLSYTIAFPTNSWCELFLKVPQKSGMEYNVFYIKQLPCPLGFIKLNGTCQCYQFLKLFDITNCDINKKALLRPAGSWIVVISHESTYVSKECPFNYCKAHAFYLNFSTPAFQCQFERSGMLCGSCKKGLSTVFGSYHCQHCSNIYILLIIPIGIAGVLLILLLFLFNLTVTDGSINAFILYVNIIGINSAVFFPHQHTVSPAYIFISLANLDLGIQICFYNGMDDYAKMWLQLAFPFYLIFLATLLIITSRYFTTIQRLTANRALPVLATLFLLSYTKILRTVSSVLFFYSSITHLPSQHTRQVWSVDANIPLFGVKFTIIFIVCLVLFLILIPFNIVLLFTKTLSRFNIISKFKPLLDAYQGPYKTKFYYWAGLQLAIRAVFFSISSLDRTVNLTMGIIILIIMNSINTSCKPFKNKYKNYQEIVLVLNQIVLYTLTLYSSSGAIVNIMVSIVAVQFSVIVLYHILTYITSDAIKDKLRSFKIEQIVRRFYRKSCVQQFELRENTAHLNIPNVTYNYQEYQEPLIGSDYK